VAGIILREREGAAVKLGDPQDHGGVCEMGFELGLRMLPRAHQVSTSVNSRHCRSIGKSALTAGGNDRRVHCGV
jgi:hypothetical protein